LPVRDFKERADEIAAAELLVVEAKPNNWLLRVSLVPTNRNLEWNTLFCFEFQRHGFKIKAVACQKHTALAAARQCCYLKRPAEVLAKLAHHSDPTLGHEKQTIGKVHAEGPDVQARKHGLCVLSLFN
jgi:hypothetical protein